MYLLCVHVSGLEELLGSAINIILIPCTGDTSPLGFHIYPHAQTCSCVNTRRSTNAHTIQTQIHTCTLAASVGLVFITRRPQWDWGWPVTESRWTPSSLSVLSCVPWTVHHSLPYPSLFSRPPLYLARCYMVPGEHRWMAFHRVCVIVCMSKKLKSHILVIVRK